MEETIEDLQDREVRLGPGKPLGTLAARDDRTVRPTLDVGWPNPPQWMDIYVDVSEGKYNQFMMTVEKLDGGLVMQLRRVARDSNRELRLNLNSSAFGPGEYLVRIDGYNWRGQTENVGWLMIGLK